MPEEAVPKARATTAMWALGVIGTGVIAVIALAVVHYRYLPLFGERQHTYDSETTVFRVLMQKNTAFAEAEALFQAKRYSEAILKYQEALIAATDTVQEGQIKIKIARATEQSGDYASAIVLYKELARNRSYINFVRAYALQNMGALLLRPESVAYRQAVFSDDPYAAMFAEGNPELALVRLFELASSLQPLALPELYIANWYAAEAVRMQGATGSKRDAYLALVRIKLTNAEADIRRVAKDENERPLLPELYKRRAIVLGKLALLGETSQQEADGAFAQAIDLHATLGPGADGYIRYYYARFLSDLGDARVADLRAALAPFYSGASYTESSVMRFFRDERSNQLGQKVTLQELARKDPRFKELLGSLGWAETDLE